SCLYETTASSEDLPLSSSFYRSSSVGASSAGLVSKRGGGVSEDPAPRRAIVYLVQSPDAIIIAISTSFTTADTLLRPISSDSSPEELPFLRRHLLQQQPHTHPHTLRLTNIHPAPIPSHIETAAPMVAAEERWEIPFSQRPLAATTPSSPHQWTAHHHPQGIPTASTKSYASATTARGSTSSTRNPRKGFSYLIRRGFLENSPQAVARFLITRKGLSKQMIGEYLGNLMYSFNMAVLACFAGEMDFSGLSLDVALRKFQTYFRMPGEAQKIERLMEIFSGRYLASNPEKRMKLEDFTKNLRNIDDGRDLDPEWLAGIYERIQSQEFSREVQQTIVAKCPILPSRIGDSFATVDSM
ncbi:Uncharacterized protein FKW44_019396, partial [Caligus rogercresseyi]